MIDRLSEEKIHAQAQVNRHAALFESAEQYQDWDGSAKTIALKKLIACRPASGVYFLGIDSGSTTTKVVLIDEKGRVAFSYYSNNNGNSIKAVQQGLTEFARHSKGLTRCRESLAAW